MASTKSCMFYKLIVSSILDDKKLRIPDKFVKKYGSELVSIAILTAPNGEAWVVELERSKEKLWFGNGWMDFVEFYSVRAGHFLTFSYQGCSTFAVNIFDLSAAEIKYPCRNRQPDLQGSKDKIKQCLAPDHVEEQAECDLKWNPCNLEKSVRVSSNVDVQFAESELVHGSRVGVITKRSNTQAAETGGGAQFEPSLSTRRWRDVRAEEKMRTVRAANMYRPSYPFFQIVLRPSDVYDGFLLHVPSRFRQQYLDGFTGNITLRVGSGEQWYVQCSTSLGQSELTKGWSQFVCENKLEEGDVCIFELVDAINIVFKVIIFRVLDEPRPSPNLLPTVKVEPWPSEGAEYGV
ncbi:unnamed protein product [Linum tenue]|uniref:TF-B3 domain-containing protein n=1 Tax=Linum tenue TaxID=586396 RepID=A0AAV0GXK6_9ROSI|nr:unnamed protein product [Linum tenue]